MATSYVCSVCGSSVLNQANFRPFCGQASLRASDLTCHSESEEEEPEEEIFDIEEVIKYYFNRGFSYKEILQFLYERHHHRTSRSTLLRKLKQYGLKRRGVTHDETFDETFSVVQRRIGELIRGSSSCMGYRSIWHTLRMEGLLVPRIIVQDLLKEMDPEGTEERKKHRLKRRTYHNPGPNYSWHMDGYDKLKHWGFPIHGGIDGHSRKVLWLEVTRSNNCPKQIASYFVDAVAEVGGCPVQLITDLGTENGLAAAIQTFFHDNHEAHRYVASTRNQRIESWWSYFSKNHSIWWRRFFTDLEFQGLVDTSCELSMECLWFCFNTLIQKELDHVKEHWNSHRIRRSRYNSTYGRPDSLFFLSATNFKIEIPLVKRNYVLQEIVGETEKNEYQEYFGYAQESLCIENPTNCHEAISLYKKLVEVSK